MRPNVRALFLLVIPMVPLAACDDDGTDPAVTFDLVFEGEASFQNAHGGQAIHVALVQGGSVLTTRDGTVSGTDDPAFAFTLSGALTEGQAYELHYWIDSNFGGGTVGVCDPPTNDHQWRLTVPAVTADVTIEDTHRPTETEDVCGSF
jgi:hypothetical protein